MEKDSLRSGNVNAVTITRENTKANNSSQDPTTQTTSSSDFVLQWGNRKRLRCMKVHVKDDPAGRTHRTSVRFNRQVVRSDKDASNQPSTIPAANTDNNGYYFNLRQRPYSPQVPVAQRILRNFENSSAMRGQSNNGGGARGLASPDRGTHEKRGTHYKINGNNGSNSSNDINNNKSDEKGGGSSSGSGEAMAVPPVWPPKFVIALTNKEKEEDFLVLKGSKLPQRPKKRAKFIQRTLNLVSPGTWLCDLTLERYEVREKKVSKKRPRGLKAMGNMESDSE